MAIFNYSCYYEETNWKDNLGEQIFNNGCYIAVCTAGRAMIETNMQRRVMRKGDMGLFFKDIRLVPIHASADFNIKVLSVEEYLLESAFTQIGDIQFWDYLYDCPAFPLTDDEQHLVEHWMEQMAWIAGNADSNLSNTVIGNEMLNLLLMVQNELQKNGYATVGPVRKDRPWILIREFYKLISRHCPQQRDVSFYAEQLNVTNDYINKVTRKMYNCTPKDIIDLEVMSGLKRYLAQSDLSINEIAHKMAFEDPSYMNRYFKRHTGMTMSEFRLQKEK